jgi:ABC-type Na+ transport system ATPase subunit NatA
MINYLMGTNDFTITTKDLTKNFESRNAVTNLNIVIKRPEIISLLGTNCTRGTTPIKMFFCLLVIDSEISTIMGYNIKSTL